VIEIVNKIIIVASSWLFILLYWVKINKAQGHVLTINIIIIIIIIIIINLILHCANSWHGSQAPIMYK